MSTSLLYHALGVRGYGYVRADFIEGTVVFTVEPKKTSLRCVACGSAEVIRKGQVDRTFSALPIGSKQRNAAQDAVTVLALRRSCAHPSNVLEK